MTTLLSLTEAQQADVMLVNSEYAHEMLRRKEGHAVVLSFEERRALADRQRQALETILTLEQQRLFATAHQAYVQRLMERTAKKQSE